MMENGIYRRKGFVGTAQCAVPTGEPLAEKFACRGERPFAPTGHDLAVGAGLKPAPTAGSIGQVSMEYAIIFAVVLAAIFATGIIDKTRNSFKMYLTKANDSMTVISKGTEAGAAGRGTAGGGEVAVGPEVGGANNSQQPQDNGMAAVVKAAGEAKAELAGLKDEYSDKKEQYDKLRAIPIVGLLLPEFDNTRDGKILKMKIGAYEKIVGTTDPLIRDKQ